MTQDKGQFYKIKIQLPQFEQIWSMCFTSIEHKYSLSFWYDKQQKACVDWFLLIYS